MPDGVARRAREDRLAAFEDHGPRADRLHLLQVMRHEHQRRAAANQLVHPVHAAQPKHRVSHRKHLINQQNVRIDV